LFFLIIIFLFFSPFFLLAPANFPEGKVFFVNRGENLRDLSLRLQTENIIKSRIAFESLVIFLGGEKNISPGQYVFSEKISVLKVAKLFFNFDKENISVKITIPEGFDLLEIAEVFSSKLNNFNKENFLDQTKDLEGYLFPDTYLFFFSDTEKEVITSMQENFNKKIANLENDIINSSRSREDFIIMASLIEEEAKGDSDRELISGILWNRIEKKMPLQVDAYQWTYKNKGLPEKPICNPGLKAIKAALYPLSSNYLYYLHDKNGKIYFAKTFEEHKKNINKYLR
jgi:UPF0755 protein